MQLQLTWSQINGSKSQIGDWHDASLPENLDSQATEKATVWVIDRGAKRGASMQRMEGLVG